MKNKKILSAISIANPIVCCVIILYLFFIKTDTIKVTWMPTPDGQEQINEYIKAGYCADGYVAEDYTYAEIRLSKWQRYKWLTFLDKDIVAFVDVAHPFREGNGRSTRIWIDASYHYEGYNVFKTKDIRKDTP